MTQYHVIITRQVTETGRGTIDVPDGAYPQDYLDTLREDGDDFLKWESDNIVDIITSLEQVQDV